MRNLENQIAIVTGSSKGIGREIVLKVAGEGAKVVVCGRDRGRVDAVVGEVSEIGGGALGFVGGLSTRDDAQRLVNATTTHFGRLDMLVNNAGSVKMEPFLDFRPETWHEHLEIHMSGAMFCAQAAARVMVERGYGRIVNISSIAAGMANPGFTAYGPVKAALESLTRVMAVELASSGITVNTVAPGPVMNDMMLKLYGEDVLRDRALTIPMARLATAAEVAHAVLFFLLPDSGYITGQLLGVDGGAKAAGCYTAGIFQQRKAAEI